MYIYCGCHVPDSCHSHADCGNGYDDCNGNFRSINPERSNAIPDGYITALVVCCRELVADILAVFCGKLLPAGAMHDGRMNYPVSHALFACVTRPSGEGW